MYKTQQRKLKEYINQHGSSNLSQALAASTPQPTLNAINNMAAMTIAGENMGYRGMNPPDSPMSAASSTGTSEVRVLILVLYYCTCKLA